MSDRSSCPPIGAILGTGRAPKSPDEKIERKEFKRWSEEVVMATMFDTEREAQAVAAELNAAGGRDVRYHVERYRKKWAIARQSKRTYWGWDEFPAQLVPPKPARRNDVETVRR